MSIELIGTCSVSFVGGTVAALTGGMISRNWAMPGKDIVLFNLSKTIFGVVFCRCFFYLGLAETDQQRRWIGAALIPLTSIAGSYYNKYWFGRQIKVPVMVSSEVGIILSSWLVMSLCENCQKSS